MHHITKQEINELLSYEPSTGFFRWAKDRKRKKAGSIAGTATKEGYVRIAINGKLHAAHRLAWVVMHGSTPSNVIDHINGIRSDNRISNLRDVTTSENAQNQKKARADNKSSGLLGAYYVKHRGNWQSQITLNGKAKHLGIFKTAKEAHEAYLKAKREIHPMCTI